MKELVFATNNANKLKEVNQLLEGQFSVLGLKQINCHEDIAETGITLKENALIKAKYVFDNYSFECFADDTGLIVPSLNGEPGVYSARYAGEEKDSLANMKLLLERLEKSDDRSAYFETVICYIHKGEAKYFMGRCDGTIEKKLSGREGFGYDPIFKPKGYRETFAEMSSEEKNKISHRGLAIQKLIQYLKNN